MPAQHPETLTDQAYRVAQDLAVLDDFLHAVAGGPPVLYRPEVDAAHLLHRQICDSLVQARRIHLWSTFHPRMLMAWNGSGFDEIDTSGYTVAWATQSLRTIERLFKVHRREVRLLREATRRVTAAAFSDHLDRRIA